MRRSTARSRRRRTCARLALALASAAAFSTASAAWDTVSDIRMGLEANDNPRLGQRPVNRPQDVLDSQDHTAVRALMDARFRLSNFGPRGNVFIQPRVRLDTYADNVDQDLKRKDGYLYAQGRRTWRRSAIGITANFARESILSSELIDSGIGNIGTDIIGEPVDTDTGELILLQEHRNRAIVAPYANFAITERSGLGLEARYLDLTYSGAQFPGRSDISETLFGISVSRTIDDRTEASARLYASDFTAVVTQNETRTVGVEGRFSRELNEIWSFNLAAGIQRSAFAFLAFDGTPIDNAAANYTFALGFGKQTETSAFALDLLRTTNPSATGYLTERNEFRILYQRQMSQRLTASAALRAIQARALDESERVSGRDIARLSLALKWAFTPTWSLNFGYEAVSQDFVDRLRADGEANLIAIGISYQGRARQQ